MIKIKLALWSWKIPLELIFIFIFPFFFIIQIVLTDCDQWSFNIIQITTWFLNNLTWFYLFLRQWTDNIGWHYFLLDILQWTYWTHTQFKHLIVQSKFKALLASEAVKFIPKTPHSGLRKWLTLTGYSMDWRSIPENGWIKMV